MNTTIVSDLLDDVADDVAAQLFSPLLEKCGNIIVRRREHNTDFGALHD